MAQSHSKLLKKKSRQFALLCHEQREKQISLNQDDIQGFTQHNFWREDEECLAEEDLDSFESSFSNKIILMIKNLIRFVCNF